MESNNAAKKSYYVYRPKNVDNSIKEKAQIQKKSDSNVPSEQPRVNDKFVYKIPTRAVSSAHPKVIDLDETRKKSRPKKVSNIVQGQEKEKNIENPTLPLEPKTEQEKDEMLQEISENLKKQFDEMAKNSKKEEKTEKRKIKKASGNAKKYTPHKKRSIWQRIAHMKKYDWGLYDDLYDINPKDLPEEERKYYWEDVEELEDAQHDFEAFQAKKTAFLVGLASVGLALAICFGTAVYKDINKGDLFNRHNTTSEMPPNEIVTLVEGDTNLRLEENRAKGYLMKFEDQEYLRNRINENFIPENATEEQMRDIMQEAWRNLEPEVQKWVREPERVYEAQKRKEAEEAVQREEQRKIEERNNQTPKETEEESR